MIVSVSVWLFQERVVQNECVCGCFRNVLLKGMSVSVLLFREVVEENECVCVAVSGAGWHGNPRHSCRHRPRLCCYHPGNQEYHHRSPSNVEHWRRHAVGGRPHPHDRLEARGAYVVHCMRRSDLVAPTLYTPMSVFLSAYLPA